MHRFPWKWRLSDLSAPEPGAPTVFSCFACGGGSSMGYKRAGFDVLGCCEIDPGINAIYRANLDPRHSFVMDVRDFNGLGSYPDELMGLDVLDGSPPCSTFSVAGDREKAWGMVKRFAEGQKEQRLDDLFFAFLGTVAALRPKAVVAENVKGLVMGNAKGYVSEVASGFRSLGYDVQLFLLDASRMGVPQRRERVFFVANRMGWPKLRLEFAEEPVTFRECMLDGGAAPTEKTAALLSGARPGETSLKKACERACGRGKRFNDVVLWPDAVPVTLKASGAVFKMPSALHATPREMLNVSSFPQDYRVPDSKAQFVAGMSVPPSMMANVAAAMRDQWPL